MDGQGISARSLATEAGCYEAWRAAALSGVPESTIYYWARTGLIVPSISPTKEMLWSYGDLMALRIVSWLRHKKDTDEGIIRASPMREVRRSLSSLDKLDLNIWEQGAGKASPLLVDRNGRIFIRTDGGLLNSSGQAVLSFPEQFFNLLAPFEIEGRFGPDLLRPRPHLRIVPLKVAGEPHIENSRITTRSLSALNQRGFSGEAIARMYDISRLSVADALDLERQLSAPSQAA